MRTLFSNQFWCTYMFSGADESSNILLPVFLDFSMGKGEAVTNELDTVEDERQLQRESQTLKSPDILAIKGLAQFERYPAVVA